MTHTYSISGMTCNGYVATVRRVLAAMPEIHDVQIDLASGSANIKMSKHLTLAELQDSLSAYTSYQISEQNHPHQPDITQVKEQPKAEKSLWKDISVWQRASLNTLNCLIGCSIGDFVMVIYLQKFYPSVSMTVQMILATVAGLVTSVTLETVLLRSREKFSWRGAFQTALSMSFISMIAMELVMNATDFMITGGKAAFGNPMYWTALIVAMVAGFFAPLPYNYYKLKKFNKACH